MGQVTIYIENRGKPIGPYDVLIAGTALANKGVLVTHNTSEFKRIEALDGEALDGNFSNRRRRLRSWRETSLAFLPFASSLPSLPASWLFHHSTIPACCNPTNPGNLRMIRALR